MSFLLGYALGSIVTFALFYRAGKKKLAESQKANVSNAQSLNKNFDKGDEDEL